MEMRNFAKALELMKQNKQDDSVKTDLRQNSSSSSLPIKKSNKIINFPQNLQPESNEISGSGGLEKSDDSEENCIWNPLFGVDYLKKFPK